MKLHWSPTSPYVRKVMICAHETGIADRLELVHTVAAMSKPNHELMRLNPLSKIPMLVTDEEQALFPCSAAWFEKLSRRLSLKPSQPSAA
ncbi:MAG: glutathione S-transferase N-terminal domain-containing protein [Betaproteobacteria bacterium]|nr:glutathione S-transferase N-terminal domain-containing protein [Betaproteobacteria bacterium]